jgi:hypothetical protein
MSRDARLKHLYGINQADYNRMLGWFEEEGATTHWAAVTGDLAMLEGLIRLLGYTCSPAILQRMAAYLLKADS